MDPAVCLCVCSTQPAPTGIPLSLAEDLKLCVKNMEVSFKNLASHLTELKMEGMEKLQPEDPKLLKPLNSGLAIAF